MRTWKISTIAALCVAALSFSGAIAAGIDAGAVPPLDADPSMGMAIPARADLGVTVSETLTRFASSDADPEVGEVAAFVRMIVGAAKHKQWRLLIGLLLIALTWGARKFGAKKFPWLATDRGGVALHIGLSLGMALASLLLSKMAINSDSVTDAITNGLIAAGGYSMLKKLWAPAKPDRVVVAAGSA